MRKRLISIAVSAAMLLSGAARVIAVEPGVIDSRTDGIAYVHSDFNTRQMENITRGGFAAKNQSSNVSNGSGMYLSWRLLGDEPADTCFNIYKDGTLIKEKLHNTNYIDSSGNVSSQYTVAAVSADGTVGQQSEVFPVYTGAVNSSYRNAPYAYFDIPTQTPPNGTGNCTYTANDASVGDVDGDGEYEIILKWDPSNSKDNASSGVTGNVYIDCYEMDGTKRWRIDLGQNIRAGAHYTQFQVYDYDGDGKAEVAMKTAPGSKDGSGAYVTAAGNTDTIRNAADNEKSYVGSDGRIIQGPEYLTIFNGETGNAMQTIEYDPQRGSLSSWGDNSYSNRMDRFLAGTAYLDGEHPSLIMCRGYYAKSVVVAYNWDGTNLTEVWKKDSGSSKSDPFYGQGNHNLSIADLDNDGKDEIVYGSAALDHDGSLLHSMGWGHGDALHVSDFNNDGKQEIFAPLEDSPNWGIGFRSADGKAFWHYTSTDDDGRGVMDNFSPKYGVLAWDAAFGVRTIDGNLLTNLTQHDNGQSFGNFPIYWDGDIYREHYDKGRIQKWDDNSLSFGRLLPLDGATYNNSSKYNPCLQADLFGDWREEIILRKSDNTGLRVFLSLCPTKYMLTTLMHDSQYRCAIAWQNTAYNQPPHLSYYLGAELFIAESTITVKDSGGNALANATVTINSKNYVTDSSGNVKIKLQNGSYDYTVRCDGYMEASGKITVSNEELGTAAEIKLTAEVMSSETWTFDDINSGTEYNDGDKIANGAGKELSVMFRTTTNKPSIDSPDNGGGNYLHFNDAGSGQDGWAYNPETPLSSGKLVFQLDFTPGDTSKDNILLRVADTKSVSASNTYTTASDGRAFEIKTSDGGKLVFSDYFSQGSSDTKPLDTAIQNFSYSNTSWWYGIKVEYMRASNEVNVYMKTGGGPYTLQNTFTLGSGTTKSTVPKLSVTGVSGCTRGSATANLGVDNILIGVRQNDLVETTPTPIPTPTPTPTPKPTPTPIPTPTPTPTPTDDKPTDTAEPGPVETDTPPADTVEPAPSLTPTETDTPIQPTDTPVQPTDTPIQPTDTPVQPTDTPIQPTDTPIQPTDEPVQPTDTPVKPTDEPVVPTPLPGDGFTLTDVSGNTANVEIRYSAGSKTMLLIGALYDGDKLIECKFKTVNINDANTVNESLTFDNDASQYELKAFLWDSLSGDGKIRPVFDSVSSKTE